MSLVNIATGALLAKDLFGSRKGTKSRGTKAQSKGIGTFGKIVLAVGGAYVANKLIANYSKSSLESQAGNGTTEGKAADFAIRLYKAFFPWGGTYVPDGTDENAVKQIAAEIRINNLHPKVLAAYKTLYNRSLIEDLTDEGVYTTYVDIVNGTTTPPPPTNTGGTKPRTLSVGATIYGYGGYNVRTIYGALVRSSVNMEEWQIVSWKTETLAGTNGVWVEVKKKGINIVTTYKIISKGLYFK